MSTRQASGPSMVPLAPSLNSKKRSTLEDYADTESTRSLKKSKREDGTKDKKKRQKKKKRKSSIITLDLRARSKSRSATVTTQDTAQEDTCVMPENLLDEAQRSQNPVNAPEDTSPRIPYADKGKGRAKQESLPPVVESPDSQIARLQQELEAQRLLLKQHQSHLAQVHQALTCQICLDLLHKPFALAPCGHIVCYPCLVRWFTAPEAPNELHSLQEDISSPPETSHCHKKKKCPVCRTHVIERPVEVWGVKSMVTGLVRSGLIELPAPIPVLEAEASTSRHDDPWRNIFARANRLFLDLLEPRPPRPPRSGGEGLQEMGMYDADDGGIAHIDEVQMDESGDETDEYEGSFIDDSEASSANAPLERSSRLDRPIHRSSRRRDSSDEDSNVELVTDGAARQLGRGLRLRRRASNRGSVQSSVVPSDDDEGLSPPPSRITARRAITIVDLSDDSEN
ncbi:hypothetical protein C0993_005722, partial [Termitomyces sp. T159_Od127]